MGGKLRRMANEFKQQVDEAMREAELVEVREAIESVRDSSGQSISMRRLTVT
jgi:hypothetical protein